MPKLVIVALISLRLANVSFPPSEEAIGLGIVILIATLFLGVFQSILWFFYDIITLKRAVWCIPTLNSNPFRSRGGPGFHLHLVALTLMLSGLLSVLLALFREVSAISGIYLLSAGLFACAWEALMRRLFRARFQRQRPALYPT